jgi:hypothetical protein
MVWSGCRSSTSSSIKKCPLDCSTVSSPRAADTKLSPETLLHSARSGSEWCATLRASSEGSPFSEFCRVTANSPTR